MAFVLALSQAPHASAYNGGSGAESRQYWLRPTQRTHNGARISAAVSGMAAGDFNTVWADASDYIFNVRSPEDGTLGYNTLDWTPRAAFDDATQQIILGGKRIKFKVIAYSDVTGDWRELPMPLANGASRASETGHWYGQTDEDGAGNVYLGFNARHFKLNAASEEYTTLPTHETTNGANGAMYAWSDDQFTSGGLVRYAGDAQRWLRYDPDTNAWDRPAQGLGNGQHALLEYQPTCQRYLLVGGTATSQTAKLVTAAGATTAVTSAPDPISMSEGSWIVAHPAGCWLVTTFGASRKLWAVWPNGGLTDVTWEDLGAAPDAALTYPTAAWDATRGLVYIVATTGLYAYKPVALTSPGAVGAISVTDAGDSASIVGYAVAAGSISVTDSGDSASVAGAVGVYGSVAVLDSGDLSAVIGVVPGLIQVTDAGDSISIAASVVAVVRASLSSRSEKEISGSSRPSQVSASRRPRQLS